MIRLMSKQQLTAAEIQAVGVGDPTLVSSLTAWFKEQL